MAGDFFNLAAQAFPSFQHPFLPLNILRVRAQRRVQKAQDAYRKAQFDVAYARAVRAKEGFLDTSQRKEQQLIQSLVGRGLGRSSIYDEDLAYFRRMKKRALQSLGEQTSLAGQGRGVYMKGRAAQRRLGPINLFDTMAQGIAQALMMGMGGQLGAAEAGGMSYSPESSEGFASYG